MSRPRRPFGTDLPGRLPATMLKVLAAEMSDAGRLSRGKRYWTDDAVIDIMIGHGAVTAEVQGSRSAPYVVTLETRPGVQAPTRSEVTVRCTCPDDDGSGRWACKHAVAALFALSDEVLIEPTALARWRQTDSFEPAMSSELPPSRDLSSIDPDVGDDLAAQMRVPPGRSLPDLPAINEMSHPRLPDRMVADVLDDAISHLRIRWE